MPTSTPQSNASRYDGYSTWLLQSSHLPSLVNGAPPDAHHFNAWLLEYLDGPGAVFKDSVIFNHDPHPRVIASKMDGVTVDIIDGQQSVALVDSIRSSMTQSAPSFHPIPYSYSFLFFDGFRVITWETTRNVIMAAIGVAVMSTIVLASVPMALMVVCMVGLTDVMLFGYMWYVNLHFNPVTATNMIFAVGIAVDYSAHIGHAFLILEGDRRSRARGALEHIGGEVLSGAFTTWLGIVCMGAAEHYIFQVFFKMVFAIVVVGAWHGIVILPILLSIIGSKPYMRFDTLTP